MVTLVITLTLHGRAHSAIDPPTAKACLGLWMRSRGVAGHDAAASPNDPTAVATINLDPHKPTYPPTLDDFWEGRAHFVVDTPDTGLPMGESDTLVISENELWSYVHASTPSSGILTTSGEPVPFPGCVVIYRSLDRGRTFSLATPTCIFDCVETPCSSVVDHVDQQQYPRIARAGPYFLLVYEYRGRIRLRRSADGVHWGPPERVADTGIWRTWSPACPPETQIGPHPYVPATYACLNGGPPGLFVEQGRVYVFAGLGQNPGHLGCYVGPVTAPAENYQPCDANPLFTGAPTYGPPLERGEGANAYFDFRTISSADVVRVGERVYLFFEGVRGPGPDDPGDSQFGLGLARSATPRVDGPWERYPGNPILVDLPGNVGLGHADVVVHRGHTYLYTSLDGRRRSRLTLIWHRQTKTPP
jgi:hypothetical protein